MENDKLWYKDAVIYELHVKAFRDSTQDGIGDFKGLTSKLDYLEDLGITALWLLPFYPSPLRDDGYDIANYFSIHPYYGSLKDFKFLLHEAHARGIRIITELVLNHTSDQHHWFQRARRAPPGSFWREFYVWSDDPEKYKEARIIFKDFETSNWAWDPIAKSYYWHRFYSHQPDLNFENPRVRKAVLQIVDFWMKMGVDGMRLDAVPYLFEKAGTSCENLPETYAFLTELRNYLDSRYEGKMLLAEANQWPEDAVSYFGNGHSCHMAYHFPLMPRLFMAIEMEDRFPILDILEQTPSISEVNQWALFLRNHDELTLEMVTDEERDYLYKMYADDPAAKINLGIRRRLAPLLGNNRRKIEVMNVLLFSLCGTPIIYYGDEIGMGNNYYLGDRNGVRTPMQWSADRNAGFSEVNPQKLYLPAIIDPEYHYEAVNVASEQRNSQSLWWWMKRLIHIRKRIKAFGRGNMFIVPSDNQKVLSFIRSYENEYILVLINLSRFSQTVTLDLSSAYAGRVPIELFGNQAFPMIQNSPSVFTFGPHDYFWLLLKQQKEMISVQEISPITELRWTEDLYDLFEGENLEKMEQKILPPYCQNQRWFSGKNRIQQQFKIQKFIPLQSRGGKYFILFIQVEYFDAEPEVYCLPLTVVQKNDFENMSQKYPQALVAQMHRGEEKVYLVDAVYDEGFRSLLLYGLIRKDKKLGMGGHFKSTMYRSKVISPEIQEWLQKKIGTSESVHSEILKVELSNTAITYENKLFLKLFRKIEAGLHPDMEIARYFADKNLFRHTPFLLGMLEYEREYDEDYEHKENILLALLENYIPNQGDGWNYSLDALRSYYERVQTMRVQMPEPPSRSLSYCQLMKEEIPPLFKELIGTPYLEMIRLLGKRTAEMHLALAGSGGIQRKIYADFAPEAFQSLYQRSLYQSMQSQVKRSLETLKRRLYRLPEPVRKLAQEIIGRQKDIISHYFFLLQKKMYSVKIRIHGDYHLGQVLFTGNDFYIIDFEGEPLKNLNERRFKRTPIRDIAGMLRSFQYAAYVALRQLDMNHVTNMEVWANYWQQYVGIYFLRSYLEGVGGRQIVPQNPEQLDLMLKAYILDKACYELDYELNNRPDWVDIPLKGIHLMLS